MFTQYLFQLYTFKLFVQLIMLLNLKYHKK